jgi:ketosteroid isomerase-like protein|tara:strand:+ start:1318 stop:1875 length:558 start_codon:yes stop_codon:yes gene_type:complete
MRNLLLLFALSLLTSCNNTAVQKVAASLSPDAEIVEAEVNNPAGYLSTADGRSDVYDGDPSNLKLWDEYIDAHNKRDLAKIASMSHDSIAIWGPRGEYIKGAQAHSEFLSEWFENNNPKWDPYFSYTMEVEGQDGQWVISGSDLSLEVEGEVINASQIMDAFIKDGKVGAFYVYERAATLPVPAE